MSEHNLSPARGRGRRAGRVGRGEAVRKKVLAAMKRYVLIPAPSSGPLGHLLSLAGEKEEAKFEGELPL